MTTKRYFLAFPVSTELDGAMSDVQASCREQRSESWLPYHSQLMSLYTPEILDAFLVDACDAVGLSPWAEKIVHSVAGSMSKLSASLSAKLLKKRSNQELQPFAEFIESLYVSSEESSNGMNSTGCEIGEEMHDQLTKTFQSVRDGYLEAVRPELIALMLECQRISIDAMMTPAIEIFKINAVVKMFAEAAVSTSRSAGKMVINRVFKRLDEHQMLRLCDYYGNMLVIQDKSLPSD